jgi:hypothetical protein
MPQQLNAMETVRQYSSFLFASSKVMQKIKSEKWT